MSKVAGGSTEYAAAIGEDPERGDFAVSGLQKGLGIKNFADSETKGKRERVQLHAIDRGDLPARFRMVGFVLGHVRYNKEMVFKDMNRAHAHRMHAIVVAPPPDGARARVPMIHYYKYPDRVRYPSQY